ncbi:MAG: extracellular solute-binding protein, partial [bacterium]|nr:extracellular solute-binding protein [bacterium]
KIKEADIEPLVFGGKDLWPYRWAQFWGLTDQVQISMQEAQTRDIWEALYKGVPAATMFKQTLELWASLVDNAYVGPTSISMSWPESSQYFVDGGAAMLPQGPWVAGLSEVKDADPETYELGVFLFPAEPADGTRYLQAGFDRCLVVSARTKYPEEALKLFNHFASDAVLAEYLGSQTLTTLLPLEYELPPIVQKFMTDSADGPYELVSLTFPEAPGLEGELNKTFQNIQAGATVAEE